MTVRSRDWMWNEVHREAFFLAAMFMAVGGLPLRAQVTYLAPATALVSPASSSPDSGQPDESILTIKKRVDEVNVLFIATDKHGKFVRNLDQKDFAILDDHKPPQSIVNFRRETDLPIQLGLLVDTCLLYTSPSPRDS